MINIWKRLFIDLCKINLKKTNYMILIYINRYKWVFRKAKMSLDKFSGKIGKKMKKKIITDGTVGWKKIEMDILINGGNGKKM